MDILMGYWLSIAVGVFLLSMVLYGHYKGFLRMAITFSALIISLLAVRVALPHVTGYLQEHTEIQKNIGESLLKTVGADQQIFSETYTPAQERALIEQLKVPESLKQTLLENNNREIYRALNVDKFLDYIGSYLANALLELVCAVILFLLVYIGLRVLIRWLDLIARLPIIHGINQIAGAVLGGIQGLLLVWLFFLMIRICAGYSWTPGLLEQIEKSEWLRILYYNNLLHVIAAGILGYMI